MTHIHWCLFCASEPISTRIIEHSHLQMQKRKKWNRMEWKREHMWHATASNSDGCERESKSEVNEHKKNANHFNNREVCLIIIVLANRLFMVSYVWFGFAFAFALWAAILGMKCHTYRYVAYTRARAIKASSPNNHPNMCTTKRSMLDSHQINFKVEIEILVRYTSIDIKFCHRVRCLSNRIIFSMRQRWYEQKSCWNDNNECNRCG